MRMNKNHIARLSAVALTLGAALAGTASAQSTWNLVANGNTGGACAQNVSNANNFGNSWSCSGSGDAGTSVTASAYSTQSGVRNSTTSDQYINSATQYANAYMSSQGTSGFGVANRTEGLGAGSPDHAVDNNPTGTYDMVVLNFGMDVILSQVGIGWSSNSTGADLTIMRWTGAGAPTATSASSDSGGTGALLRSGWSLVSSLADVLADGSYTYGGQARNTYATEASSWWMISAFNTTLNGSTCYKDNSGNTVTEGQYQNNRYKCDDGDDAFKLNWLKTTVAAPPPPPGVPEPGTLALAGVALLGITAARRRAQPR